MNFRIENLLDGRLFPSLIESENDFAGLGGHFTR